MSNYNLQLVPVLNTQDIIKKIGNIQKGMGAGMERGLVKGGKLIFDESKKFCPVGITGNLRASARETKEGSGMTTDVEVSFGTKNDSKVTYAVYVHERLEPDVTHGQSFNAKHAAEIAAAHTPWQKKYFFNRRPQEQAKYLERPAREQKSNILNIIVKELKKLGF